MRAADTGPARLASERLRRAGRTALFGTGGARAGQKTGSSYHERGVNVLTLTDRAAATIRSLTSQPGIPAETGLRMSVQDGEAGTLALSLESPQPGDAVIEDGGAKVFVERDAAEMLGDSELDAELDDQGHASFMLGGQPPEA